MQGNARLFQQAQGNQPLAILGTLLIVYIVLGVLYESYVHPLTILSTLPSAGLGAFLALAVLQTESQLASACQGPLRPTDISATRPSWFARYRSPHSAPCRAPTTEPSPEPSPASPCHRGAGSLAR